MHLWVLRHGRSLANERGLIVSELSNGVLPEYGLHAEGFEQARAAGVQLKEQLATAGLLVDHLHVVCSPFSRTMDTANTVREVLGLSTEQEVVPELRERYFGSELELGPHDRYSEVWEVDAQNENSPAGGTGESVQSVADRVGTLLKRLEGQHEGVLLVGHGDTLQITQAVVLGGSTPEALRAHRKFAMNTGELRKLS